MKKDSVQVVLGSIHKLARLSATGLTARDMNQGACCTWHGAPRWRTMALAYWDHDKRHATQRKLQQYRTAMSAVAAEDVFVCFLSHEQQLVWGVWYGLLAKRMQKATVHLIVTHHALHAQLLAVLGQLACPEEYATITEMLPVQILPLEYLFLSLEFPNATHVWCDNVCWAAVRGMRPDARRWLEGGGCKWSVNSNCGSIRHLAGS